MSRVLGKAPAPASPAEQAAAKEQRRRGRFRAAKRLARFNAWLFGPKLVDGKWVKGDRIGTCGRKLVGRGDDAPKYPGLKRLADGDGRVTWTGIETCGSVWACLACAAKIRAARAEEIDYLAKAHIAAGGSCTFVTFTLPHIASDDLEILWRAVQRAWRMMVSGSSYQAIKARYGMLGTIRAVEATLGSRNGWHPHLHVLFFHDSALHGNDGTLEEFRDALGARWGRYIEAELGRQVHELYGVDAVPVRDEAGIGAYVSKIHYELARSDLKVGRNDGRSRSPWQVGIDAAETGEKADIRRWQEWVRVTKGSHALSLSPVLRRRYGRHATADQTDEELAGAVQDGETEVEFDHEVYNDLYRHRDAVLADVALVYQDQGLPGLRRYLAAVFSRRALVMNDGVGPPRIEWDPLSKRLVARNQAARSQSQQQTEAEDGYGL